MVRGIYRLLKSHGAFIFASVVPRSTRKPITNEAVEYLRKDQVFLLERYFNFAHSKSETGLLVFDETDESADRHFIRQIERYFTKTNRGRFRATAIVPVPLFVSSDLTRAIQAADICIYTLNWCFRAPRGMDAEKRDEVASEFERWVYTLQASGQTHDESGTHPWFSIVYVPEPYGGEDSLNNEKAKRSEPSAS